MNRPDTRGRGWGIASFVRSPRAGFQPGAPTQSAQRSLPSPQCRPDPVNVVVGIERFEKFSRLATLLFR